MIKCCTFIALILNYVGSKGVCNSRWRTMAASHTSNETKEVCEARATSHRPDSREG